MISNSTLRQIQGYAREDIIETCKLLKDNHNLDVTFGKLSFDVNHEEDYVDVVTKLNSNTTSVKVELSYAIEGDDILVDITPEELVHNLAAKKAFAQKDTVESSTYIKADDSGELIDTIDDLSDTVEDLQDTVDEIDEDDIGIEIDNSISNHYIAECDKCGGIFISAVVESDQVVSKISGVCPLCDNETEQYLRWIVRDADIEEEEEIEPRGESIEDDVTDEEEPIQDI